MLRLGNLKLVLLLLVAVVLLVAVACSGDDTAGNGTMQMGGEVVQMADDTANPNDNRDNDGDTDTDTHPMDVDSDTGDSGGDDSDSDRDSGDTPAPSPAPQRTIGNDIGDIAPDFTLRYIGEGSDGTGELKFSDYRGDGPALVVFFRTRFCTFCVGQLNAIQRDLNAITERGVRVIAVSSDNENTAGVPGRSYSFPLAYTGADDSVPRAYDRIGYVRDGSYAGRLNVPDLADPGVFLVDGDGVIVWRSLGNSISHTVSVDTITAQIDSEIST